jgi:hypothetical protein
MDLVDGRTLTLTQSVDQLGSDRRRRKMPQRRMSEELKFLPLPRSASPGSRLFPRCGIHHHCEVYARNWGGWARKIGKIFLHNPYARVIDGLGRPLPAVMAGTSVQAGDMVDTGSGRCASRRFRRGPLGRSPLSSRPGGQLRPFARRSTGNIRGKARGGELDAAVAKV